MLWNVNYIFESLVILTIILFFYRKRQTLPLKRNRLFYNVVNIILINGVVNISATLTDMYFDHARVILYILNYTYFILLEISFYAMFLYYAERLNMCDKVMKNRFKYLLPVIISAMFILVSYIMHDVFYIDEFNHFQRGVYYWTINLPFLIYAFILYLNRKTELDKNTEKDLYYMKITFVITLIGLVVNFVYDKILFLEMFQCFAILIMYISIENPELYINSVANTYNSLGFRSLVTECITFNKPYYVYGFKVTNFMKLKNHHGMYNLNIACFKLGTYLKEYFSDQYVFLIDVDTFAIVSDIELDVRKIQCDMIQRLKEPFGNDVVEVYVRGIVYEIEDTSIYDDVHTLLLTISDALKLQTIQTYEILKITRDDYKKTLRSLKIREILTEKIEAKKILVYYQPLYSTKEHQIVGCEALARLEDDENKIISPAEFIPIAESTGQIVSFGLGVFEKVCEFIKSVDLNEMGIEFVGVNISPIQLQDLRLADAMYEIALKYEVDFSIFDFEITETSIEQDTFIHYQINKLRTYGASISLDDFGTGSSNLERLLKYPFTIAKLDMTLVWNYFGGKNKVMEDVISMFKKEDLKVVAEGVEEAYMIDALSNLDCDYIQGYYISKPLPKDQFKAFVYDKNHVNKT